jgi:hypothetical protein
VAQFATSAARQWISNRAAYFFGTKPFSSADENILKHRLGIVTSSKWGLVMQFIFDLIWTQSRSRYLAAIGQPEAEH